MERFPDPSSPIIPGKSLGGFLLGDHIGKHTRLLFKTWRDCEQGFMRLVNPMEARYVFLESIMVSVDVYTGRIFKLIAQKGYRGSLLGSITVGMPCRKAKEVVQNLYFDETHSLLRISNTEGVCLEIDEEDPLEETIWKANISFISVTEPSIYQEMERREVGSLGPSET
jgi:hypothetical protein